MSERAFRLILGIWLIAGVFFARPEMVHGMMVVLLLEGLTNLRLPLVLWRLRHGMDRPPPDAGSESVGGFEAERALRFVIIGLLALGLFLFPAVLWWVPWFLGFALIGAGLSGLCPMVQALRWAGLP